MKVAANPLGFAVAIVLGVVTPLVAALVLLCGSRDPRRSGRGGPTSDVTGGVDVVGTKKVARGTSSRSNSNLFAPSVLIKNVTPVTLWPGRFRLETRPSSTGSAPIAKTIGVVALAVLTGQRSRRSEGNEHGRGIGPARWPTPVTARSDHRPSDV
jgi:hypothetical protein